MLYRPPAPHSLWDTCLLEHRGEFHLFYLEDGNVGHAASTDLAHWSRLPSLDLRGPQGSWNQDGTPMLGSIVSHDDAFYMFAGSHHPADKESVYGVFISQDLQRWTPHPANPVLRAPRTFGHLNPEPRDGYMFNAWRDPFVIRDPGGDYHAYLCARNGAWSSERTGACVAHATSRDLIEWTHHEPIFETNRVKYLEVPGLIDLDGRYYLYFLDHGWGGLRIHTPSREDTAGTYYVIGDNPTGPFEWPADPLLAGGGRDREGPWAARTMRYEGGHLLFHHITAQRSAFAIPKPVRTRADGTLYLDYLPVVEALETAGPALESTDLMRLGPVPRRSDSGRWTVEESSILGECGVAGASLALSGPYRDIHAQVVISSSTAARASLVVRSDAASGAGVVVTLDYERQRIEVDILRLLPFEGWGRPASDVVLGTGQREGEVVRRPLSHGQDYHLRCIVRAEFIEIYLDGEWVCSRALRSAPDRGSVEVAVERGRARFSALRLAHLAPLD